MTKGLVLLRRDFLATLGGAAFAAGLPGTHGNSGESDVPSLLDHFILGCADLDRGIEFVERYTGVRAAFGGVHPGRGTRNALLSLGERRYLEIMAPDPAQNVAPQIANLGQLKEPRIVGWAAHRDDLDQFAERLRKNGIDCDGPQPGSRQRPDGQMLHWKSLRLKDDHGGLLPFFIEWSTDSVHPSVDAPKGCTLRRFVAITPETKELSHAAARLQLDLYVSKSTANGLQAEISGPKGVLVLPLTS